MNKAAHSTSGRLSSNTTIAISTTLPCNVIFVNNSSSSISIMTKFEFRLSWSSASADGTQMALKFEPSGSNVSVVTINKNSSLTIGLQFSFIGDSSKIGKHFAS